jgi:hypothetical protein
MPQTNQTRSVAPTDPTSEAIPLGVMKMPEPGSETQDNEVPEIPDSHSHHEGSLSAYYVIS